MDFNIRKDLHPKLDHKCVHEENRMKICAPCGQKIVFGKKKSEDFLISQKHSALIKKHINHKFDLSNPKYPISICVSCRLTISDREKGVLKRPLPIMPNYEDIILAKETRTTSFCNCYVCSTAQFKGHSKICKGKGHTRTFSAKIDVSNGLEGAMPNVPIIKHEKNMAETKTSIKLCVKCYQEIGKGIRHVCNGPSSSTSARENISSLMEKLPEKQQNQIITSYLKRKSTESDQKDELILNTTGAMARISLNKKKEKKVTFTAESLDGFQATTGVSNNYMIKMTNFIRCSAGRQSIPKNYRNHMHTNSNAMEQIYKEDVRQFDIDKDKKESRPVVYANASELLDFIFEKRDIKQMQESKIKLMADGGQNFFKVCISILTDEDKIKGPDDEYKNQRALYSDGGSSAKKRKLNSVYRLIILCIVPRIKETYDNIKTLVELTELNDIPFKFSSDFKLILMVNGQQTASATYPCPYCFITLTEVQQSQVKECDLKTFKHLKEDYEKFKSNGKDKKLAPQCHSVVNHPLFVKEDNDEDDDLYVIQKCVLPELHLLTGFVNHLFWNGLVPILGREKALLWPKKLNLIPRNYHGEIFEGNACRKLLKEADKLEDPEIYKEVGIFRMQPFVASFKAMDKIVDSYFSTKQVDLNDIDEKVTELRKAFQSTGVSQSLKIHVILDHLKQGLIHLNCDGLGLWSEQAGESVHREFLKYWERFKINAIDDETYSSRLKKAVVTFSSQHI